MNATSPLAPKSIAATDIVVRAAPRSRNVLEPRLEYVPVNFYHLLRRLARGPLPLRELHGVEIEAAIAFLVSRGLAGRQTGELVITPAGHRIGQIPNDSNLGTPEPERPLPTPASTKSDSSDE
jgi:hypothetical protein